MLPVRSSQSGAFQEHSFILLANPPMAKEAWEPRVNFILLFFSKPHLSKRLKINAENETQLMHTNIEYANRTVTEY